MSDSGYEPIALVGIGCRFPGGASSPNAFWKFLKRGGDAIVDVPKDRWDIRRFYSENSDKPGKTHAKKGGYLTERIDQFDSLFFGISPREAQEMDPQQRLLLEVAWEAFEDAGIPHESLQGSNTGVYIGGFALDNLINKLSAASRHEITSSTPAGIMMTILAARISHAFDLLGPSVSMDTACSSALVSIHYACQGLWQRECDMAVAGGVNVMFRPELPILMSKGKFLSKHGYCKAFDEDAGGYTRGEGAGIVVLKRLSDALRDGDRVYCLVGMTGVNQDGHTAGISLPNASSQKALVSRVYKKAAVLPKDLKYIEAHGTGTQAGDPIELTALNSVLSENRNGEKCWVGSVKSNMGHLEAAAGVAGFIKAALVLYHKQVPPNLHFKKPNPQIPFQDICLQVPTQVESLESEAQLFAGVNSFGYGGTNAHAVLQSFVSPQDKGDIETVTDANHHKKTLIPLSARSEQALSDLLNKYLFMLAQKGSQLNFADLVYSMAMRRSHHAHRAVFAAGSIGELQSKMQSLASQEMVDGVDQGHFSGNEPSPLVFIYSGMGPQWWAMGRELMQKEPIFRQAWEKVDEVFTQLAGWSIGEALGDSAENSRVGETQVAQPANFALQVALTELWKHWGIEPVAVMGHSVGEVAAAYVSGALTLEDAVLVSYYRSHYQQTCAGKGTMLAIGLAENEANELIADEAEVSIAALNSPGAVTLAGTLQALTKVSSRLEKDAVFNRFLKVEVAYHSYQMDAIEHEILQALQEIKPRKAHCKLYSSVLGEEIQGEMMGSDYWWQNVRQPVRFAKGVKQLLADGYANFLELGPHPVLSGSIKECGLAKEVKVHVTPSLNRKSGEMDHVLTSLSALYVQGSSLHWSNLLPGEGTFIPLPTYAWQREYCWSESDSARQDRLGNTHEAESQFVYFNENLGLPTPTWEVEFNEQFFPFIHDHIINDKPVFPGAGYLDIGFCLQQLLFEEQACVLSEINFHKMLILEPGQIQKIHVQWHAAASRYDVFSRELAESTNWQLLTSARIIPNAVSKSRKIFAHVEAKERCELELSPEILYDCFKQRGNTYVGAFRRITNFWMKENQFLIKIRALTAQEKKQSKSFALYPTLLDAPIHATLYLMSGNSSVVPVSISRLSYYLASDGSCWAYGKVKQTSARTWQADIVVYNSENIVCVEMEKITFQALTSNVTDMTSWFHKYQWVEPPKSELGNSITKASCLVLDVDSSSCVNELLTEMATVDIKSVRVTPGVKLQKLLVNHYEMTLSEAKSDLIHILEDSSTQQVNSLLYACALDLSEDELELSINTLANYCTYLTALVQAWESVYQGKDITLMILTRGAQAVDGSLPKNGLLAAPVIGLGQLIANEHPHLSCQMVDLDRADQAQNWQEIINHCFTEQLSSEIALRSGKKWAKELMRIESNEEDHLSEETQKLSTDEAIELQLKQPGNLDSFYFQRCERIKPGPNEVEIKVAATSLNYKDLVKAFGKLSRKVSENTYLGDTLGMELSGVITALGKDVAEFQVGDEVVTFVPGSFRAYCKVSANHVVLKPKSLSFEEAPLFTVFLTAYYGLLEIAGIKAGEKILIHSATGGLGLAAIQMAQWVGAEIFATAGNEERRQYLRSLGIQHVMDSRSNAFAQQIRKITNDYGVDVVINALTGEALFESFNLLAPYGRFIEVGKKDIIENSQLPMAAFNQNLLFAAVDVDRMAMQRPKKFKSVMNKVTEAFDSGLFKALPTQVYTANEVSQAFRLMAQNKHIGKIAVTFQGQQVDVAHKKESLLSQSAEGAYLITGGTSGFGLEVAKWLAKQGMGQVILVSRSGGSKEIMGPVLEEMDALGTEIIVKCVDVSDETQVEQLIAEIKEDCLPLYGVIHGATVLDDGLLSEMTAERYAQVMQAKAMGAWYLHEHTKELPLKSFIMFSSISSIIGNRGQANYVAANSFLDALCYHRKSQGLPVLTLNWGALGEVGIAARQAGVAEHFEKMGVGVFSIEQALTCLAKVMDEPTQYAQIGLFDLDWTRWSQTHPHLVSNFKFQQMVSNYAALGGTDGEASHLVLKRELELLDEGSRMNKLEQELAKHIGKILRISSERVDCSQSLNEMGIDSLMLVELTLVLKTEFGLEFSNKEMSQSPTIESLVRKTLQNWSMDAVSRLQSQVHQSSAN
ncbi:MAG: SDR family NAD(P)-dependent oxidoreductase [Verrucomicrobiota bacterium]